MNRYWTALEIDTLCHAYSRLTPQALTVILPGRSVGAINKKAQRLMLRASTMQSELIEYIRTTPMSASSTAHSFGCSVRTVYRARKKLNNDNNHRNTTTTSA